MTTAVLGGGFWLFREQLTDAIGRTGGAGSGKISATELQNRLSGGEKILVAADTTAQKQAGVRAFADRKFEEAIAQFQNSLEVKPNDPETLIYLNNAQAASGNPLKIAVSVPIGGNLNIAREILRGAAQAQNEVNEAGGIDGRLLQVAIANDDNNPTIAQHLARKLARDRQILAVVGHNSSNASLAAAPEYQAGQLTMISPTSDANQLAEVGDYIFRTIPSVRFQADTLSRYTLERAKIQKVAVCADSGAEYSQSLKEEFIAAMFADGGQVVPIDCDLAAPDFKASAALSRAISNGAEALLAIPAVNRLNLAIALAKENQQRLALFGSSAMHTFETLKQGQAAVNGMVLAVPWNAEAFADNPFTEAAKQLWGGSVNWRTALTYDAMQAIIAGLNEGEMSREGLQNAIAASNFSAQGATGSIQFLPSGNRNGAAILVKIQPGNQSGTGWDFVPVSE
ncbi:MAG: ABC transporter substrate-binding protein [Cyanobacteriota bacterium]|nr:ABC transporter substrate-binding protein [Cyanobacteriota bacterium]